MLSGDHGMSDQGGHGGASSAETGIPIAFLSPHAIFEMSGKSINQDYINLFVVFG